MSIVNIVNMSRDVVLERLKDLGYMYYAQEMYEMLGPFSIWVGWPGTQIGNSYTTFNAESECWDYPNLEN